MHALNISGLVSFLTRMTFVPSGSLAAASGSMTGTPVAAPGDALDHANKVFCIWVQLRVRELPDLLWVDPLRAVPSSIGLLQPSTAILGAALQFASHSWSEG